MSTGQLFPAYMQVRHLLRTLDRKLLTLVLLLIGLGVVAVLIASPASAVRYSDPQTGQIIPELHYFKRHVLWVAIGVPVMLVTAALPIALIRRMCVLAAPIGLMALLAVPFFGLEANGAHRWLSLAGLTVQPSEFVKPVLIVTLAWIMSSRFEDRHVPALVTSVLVLAPFLVCLVLQPDFGQLALLLAVWFVMASLAGMNPAIGVMLGGLAALGGGLAYATVHHVRERIDGFLFGKGDTFQIDQALASFRSGGLLGKGPSEGTVKLRLPEAHTDYIFAVAGEGLGAIACICLVLLYLSIVVRVMLHLMREEDPFVMLAAGGLITQFGLQAFINMAVNLALLPSKGMTLPFVSHGGSSFVAIAFSMGIVLAMTRRKSVRGAWGQHGLLPAGSHQTPSIGYARPALLEGPVA